MLPLQHPHVAERNHGAVPPFPRHGAHKRRRKQYGLRWEDGALIIADDVSVHSDHRFAELRRLWETENNCLLLGCDKQHPIQVPGGFGAAGAPNDQWHQTWRLLRRAWLRKAVGSANPAYGRMLEEAQWDLRGEICTTCPWMTSLRSDIYALQALRTHRKGNIVMSAWHRLGYIDMEELAKLNFNCDLHAAEAAMEQARGSMFSLINLDVLPHLNLQQAAQELDAEQIALSVVGKKHVWWHHDNDDRCCPLPQWLNAPMELQMQGWIKEHQKWQADIAARGGKGLTAAQAKKHQEWQENPVRLVLLDASRHVAFPPGDGRASKGCKGLHIQMIMAPEELKVKVGGTFRSLSVRQYLDGEECPITTQVNDTLLQPLHNSIVANAGEEEDEEAAGGIPLDDAEEHVAGQALGKANPEEVDGAVEWDFVWVDAGKAEQCFRQGVQKH